MLPARYVRREMVDRGFGPPGGRSHLWCGFLAKDRPSDDLVDVDGPDWTLVWLLRGHGIYKDSSGERRLAPGDLVVRRPGRRHSTIADRDRQWVEFFLVIDARLGAVLAGMGTLADDEPVLHPGIDLSLVERCDAFLGELRRAAPDALGGMLARAHLLLAEFHALDRQRRQGDRRGQAVERARRLLDSDFTAPLPDIARRVGLGYEVFRKAFAAQVGEPPHAYRLRRRIEAARALLMEERTGVAEVADRLGFADVFTFSKQFRRLVGEPPARWRRHALGAPPTPGG